MGGKKEKIDGGFSLFGAQTLRRLTEDLEAEADGVRESDDIEYIHRMRVASRRVRAALPLFAPCLPESAYKKARKGVRSITRSLGAARDLDVQIEFLQSFLHSLPDEHPPVWYAGFLPPAEDTTVLVTADAPPVGVLSLPPSPGIRMRMRELLWKIRVYITGGVALPAPCEETAFQPLIRPGIECLLLRWTERRASLHPEVVSSVDAFESSGVADVLLEWCRDQIVSAHLHETDIHSRFTYEAAYHAISTRLEELISFERYVPDPTRIAEHHEMRIAAKRLRYTMEIFSDLYPDALKKPIQVVKKLQDLLGDMHDCDVWLDVLPHFMEEEESRVRSFFGHNGFMRFIRPGLLHLADDRRCRRNELYELFSLHWKAMVEDDLIEDIRQKIVEPFLLENPGLHGTFEGRNIRIALIGDIHSNLPALQAVIADAEQRGATHILHLGDLIGFGPHPEETLQLIGEKKINGIAGNIDIDTLSLRKNDCRKKAVSDDVKMQALCWTRKQLSKDSRSYLRSLPREIRTRIGDMTLLLTHGSPESTTGRIGPHTPDMELLAYANTTGVDLIVSAHTHVPFTRTVSECHFINTGSVGRPADGDPRACYCLLEANPLSICHIRIPYDIESVTGAIQKAGLPAIFCTMLRHGIPIGEAGMIGRGGEAPKEIGGISAECSVDKMQMGFEPQ
ncbi:CHAD domain-containing protein [Methanocalculus taiwanensis]|uniref:CHAD domain-containing protein n=1 Tax=Methanocalculus taiwanensis TaxID=106207 RepID=A0ABD4THJ2_9EURY|nr:CHAD domain-containing protein [Methanocalculus taiwanensis]MCQ1538422.1 CHAD domain-containing protein [Methanocalculus taiwanensis]